MTLSGRPTARIPWKISHHHECHPCRFGARRWWRPPLPLLVPAHPASLHYSQGPDTVPNVSCSYLTQHVLTSHLLNPNTHSHRHAWPLAAVNSGPAVARIHRVPTTNQPPLGITSTSKDAPSVITAHKFTIIVVKFWLCRPGSQGH